MSTYTLTIGQPVTYKDLTDPTLSSYAIARKAAPNIRGRALKWLESEVERLRFCRDPEALGVVWKALENSRGIARGLEVQLAEARQALTEGLKRERAVLDQVCQERDEARRVLDYLWVVSTGAMEPAGWPVEGEIPYANSSPKEVAFRVRGLLRVVNLRDGALSEMGAEVEEARQKARDLRERLDAAGVEIGQAHARAEAALERAEGVEALRAMLDTIGRTLRDAGAPEGTADVRAFWAAGRLRKLELKLLDHDRLVDQLRETRQALMHSEAARDTLRGRVEKLEAAALELATAEDRASYRAVSAEVRLGVAQAREAAAFEPLEELRGGPFIAAVWRLWRLRQSRLDELLGPQKLTG